MILEELLVKVIDRLVALEVALKEKGILDEADIVPGSYPEPLPPEVGERIRKLNASGTLDLISAKRTKETKEVKL